MGRNPDRKSEIRDRPDLTSASRSARADYSLRRYLPDDERAALALWLRTWRAAYPQIDFAARLDWWGARWRNQLAPNAEIVIAQSARGKERQMIGFVTVDARTHYVDQIVVAPEHWGSGVAAALVTEAKRVSPSGLDLDVNIDNARAIRFYEKHGFSITGAGVNPISGKPVHRMSWQP
jgi:putative acetyltransferase